MSHNPSHTELTAIYLPIDRRHALAYGLQLPRQAHGAALFADISGFTVLTESLKRSLGPRQGAERLAIYLNQVYDALIAEVDRYGGSVIGFSGDAITCWFDDTFIHRVYAACGLEQPSAQPAVLRAVTAALAIQKAMLQFSTIEVPGQGVFPLRVKAAVACGQVQRLLVGDPQHQLLDATAGETLLRMAAAEKQALPSQTIVDQATTAALGDQLEIEQQLVDEYGQHFSVIRGMRRPAEAIPWPALPGERLDEGQISPWLLKPVYQRLVQLQGEFLTELRPAAALFLRFSGIDFENDPACGEALDGYIRWVQTIVARYDGTFIQLTVGEKGSYLYVAFGAPRAHEDDPLRAARAALELARTPAQLAGIRQVQIGLSLGAMRTGSYGGRTRRTYGVLGDDVNLAARLMQAAAPGQILASGQLREALGPACRWQDLPPMQVKGKNEPVPVAALLGLMDWQPVIFAGRRPLVGRKAELEQAVQAGARLSSIPPSFAGAIVLDGDAGIGKSRLAQELHEQLGEWQELRWLECPCDAILGQSLHPFKYWLRRYFNQDSLLPVEQNKAHFEAGLAALLGRLESHGGEAAGELQRELQRTRSMLGALVDLHWADSLYEQLEPKLRLENTLRALRALIYAESLVQAVVVHLEDAHHLDPDSQVLLKQLVHTPARYPVLVLVSGRFCTQEDETCYQLPDEVLLPAVYLHLADLDSAEVQQMAAEILNNGSMRPAALGVDLLNFFLEKTSGNPLFIEALAEELSERDLVWVKNNHWTLKQTRSEEVPAGLNALLITRLDRLDPLMKNAVQTAAVIGREFEPAVLSQMLSAGEEAGLVIARAQQEQIWLDSGSGRQVFRQTLMRDAAYAMQPQARLQSLHAHTARSIELVHTPDLDPHFTDLAFHFSQARDDQQAFYYARQAGEAAAAQYANSQAMYWFQLALDCAGRLPAGSALAEQGAVHTALGELLTTTGQREPAAVHLNQALELFEQTGSREAQAHACRWLARLSENRGEFPQALAWIERGLAILGDQESVETSELLNNAGLIYSRRGDFAAAEHSAGRCLEIARKLGQPKPLARAHNLSGHIARLRGESGAAIEQFSRSLAIYQSAGDLNGQALAHNQLANALIGTGRWQEAGQHFNQARQAFEQIGDTYHRIFVDNNLGWIALNQGDLDLALSYYQGGLAALEETGGSPYVLGTFQMNLGATYVRLGDAAAARQQLATSQATFEKAGARDFLPELHRHLASAALLDGDLPLARRNAEQALQLAREFKMRAEEGCTLRVLGEIESAAGQVQPARRCLQESLEIMGEIGDHYERARSLLALARLAADAHLPEAVIASFKELLPRLQAMGARQEWIEVQSFLHQVEPEWVLPLDKP